MFYIGKSKMSLQHSYFHRHNTWELIYNVKGSGRITIGDKEYPFGEGSIHLCPPGVPHSKWAPAGFEDYYITFSDESLTSKVYALEDLPNQEMFHILQAIYTFYHQESSRSVYDALFHALMQIVKSRFASRDSDKYVNMLRQIIVDSFTDPKFQLETACAGIPQNIDHLRRNFKRIVGITPHRYLTRLRIENAKHILKESPDMKVYIREVAVRCGFDDPLYFSKIFKKETGISPSMWQ